jgi:hypothetical protein
MLKSIIRRWLLDTDLPDEKFSRSYPAYNSSDVISEGSCDGMNVSISKAIGGHVVTVRSYTIKLG